MIFYYTVHLAIIKNIRKLDCSVLYAPVPLLLYVGTFQYLQSCKSIIFWMVHFNMVIVNGG